jgi:hypothetical protein
MKLSVGMGTMSSPYYLDNSSVYRTKGTGTHVRQGENNSKIRGTE